MAAVLSSTINIEYLNQDFEIRPFDNTFGAEILNLDLSRPLSDEDFKRVHQAHLEHHVIVFRQQNISPAQQVSFSRRFGPLQKHVLSQFALENHPEVLVISNIKKNNKAIGLVDAGYFWHSDLSYLPTPSLGSLLYAQELPRIGGDTLFADQHAAYDALPQDLRERIEFLHAEHWYLTRYEELLARNPWRPKLTQEQIDQVKPVVHPIVRTHPETGRKGLFVSEHFTTRIIGLSENESREILAELFHYSTLPQFIYRHQWQEHDIVFWDNRSVLHLATGTPAHLRRKLYRTTVEGTVPF
ncbi:MAG: TauD/TfdA family dioxygenase [Pelistega sp.]|nr:TauD/TfdA family dioxygenase [Pelistega sp.]